MKNSQTRILLQTLLLNDPAVGSEKYEAMMETYDGKRASVRCPLQQCGVRCGNHGQDAHATTNFQSQEWYCSQV